MKHRNSCVFLMLVCSLAGCAGHMSTLREPESYPPGHYGLYETDKNLLVGKYNLAADETFAFQYQSGRCIATTIERLDDNTRDYQVVEKIALNPARVYEWRRLDKPTTKPS